MNDGKTTYSIIIARESTISGVVFVLHNHAYAYAARFVMRSTLRFNNHIDPDCRKTWCLQQYIMRLQACAGRQWVREPLQVLTI